jgi:23S rRNA pseudouridine1911/1915/1917 synthase
MSWADSLELLFEDNHLIAVNKPCGWPSAHFGGSEPTIDQLVKDYLREKYQKPGNVFLGVVHRLDKPVSGVLLFARTSKAASRLAEQFRTGSVEKVYWAIVECGQAPPAMAATFDDWLLRDDARAITRVVSPRTPGAIRAVTHVHHKAEHAGLRWLELRPQTGRKHQLRAQLAARGWPIHGDVKYGSGHRFGAGIGLHARSLTFLHPIRHEPITLTADPPASWRGRFAHLLAQGAAP